MNLSSQAASSQRLQSLPSVLRAVVMAAQLTLGVARRLAWRVSGLAQGASAPVQDGQPMYNNRNDGPPDLDELWRDFNRKLSGVFSGKDGGGNDQGPGGSMSPDPRSTGIGIGVVLGLVALIWAGSGIFIVQEGQQGVVLTFGRFSHTVDAGLRWRAPYPFQQHEVVNLTQLRSIEVGNNSVVQSTGLRDSFMLTRDENIVDIRFTVQYRLSDAKDYLFETRSPDEAVLQAAESAVREIVGTSTMDSVLYEQRDAIAAELVKSIQAQVNKIKAGVLISNVNVQSVQAPEQVQAAFDDAFKAGADRERLKNEAQAYANEVIPKAQGTAARLREEAAGYSARVAAQAEGDAQRFKSVLTEYQKAPGVTRDRLYTDTMQQIYSNVSKVLVDSRQGSNLLYLPLDKLMQASGSQNGGAAAAASVETTPVTPSSSASTTQDARARDGARSRDREVR